jgi:hypothetical protein
MLEEDAGRMKLITVWKYCSGNHAGTEEKQVNQVGRFSGLNSNLASTLHLLREQACSSSVTQTITSALYSYWVQLSTFFWYTRTGGTHTELPYRRHYVFCSVQPTC